MSFHSPKGRLALCCKNVGNGLSGLGDDIVVEVDEVGLKMSGELLAPVGFASAHEAEKGVGGHGRKGERSPVGIGLVGSRRATAVGEYKASGRPVIR